MAVGVSFSVELRGLGRFRNLLRTVARGLGGRAELHQRYGILALRWVDRNFQQEGGMTGQPWRKLSPNTIAGRRKGSAKVLQDSGELRRSFSMRFSAEDARVGSNKAYAAHHEFGTKPYSISPKARKFLAFPHAQGKPLSKSFTFPSSERKFPKGTPFVFTKGPVKHPGLSQRRLLPRQGEPTLMPELIRASINYLNELRRRGQGGG